MISFVFFSIDLGSSFIRLFIYLLEPLSSAGVSQSLSQLSLGEGGLSHQKFNAGIVQYTKLERRRPLVLSSISQFASHACFWIVGGRWRTWREPVHIQGEHANSEPAGRARAWPRVRAPPPCCCEATALITAAPRQSVWKVFQLQVWCWQVFPASF